jgi:two-component system CheB/CheR fusion protein
MRVVLAKSRKLANEELQSANEELLSGSEELQSLNEELETSKEELQSTNEEIIVIVNKELLGQERAAEQRAPVCRRDHQYHSRPIADPG